MTMGDCKHDVVPCDDPNWGRCTKCGDETFPLTASAAYGGEATPEESDLVAEVVRLRARLAEVEAERDQWKALADEAAPVAVAAMKAEARAEQAERERDEARRMVCEMGGSGDPGVHRTTAKLRGWPDLYPGNTEGDGS